jgi:DNA-binding XRE family transcriptional regulator
MQIAIASGRHGPPHHLALKGGPAIRGKVPCAVGRSLFYECDDAEEGRMITREELKAARNLLGWSQMTLSIEADVSIPTLVGFERGQKSTRARTVLKIQRTLEKAGVFFLDAGPVRMPLAAAE